MSEQQHEQESAPEREPMAQPRIYVASLSDYNAGRLHGVWLNANQDVEELQSAVGVMLKKSHEPWAEEYAVHDYENFGPVRLGEYTSLATVAAVAHGLIEHGQPFGHWAEYVDCQADELERFEECYRGQWESLSAWAEEAIYDLGVYEGIDRMPEWVQPYVHVDFVQLGEDMSQDYFVADDSEGIYVFDAS